MSRAVSDLIGFSLMFSIIILGVALVSTAGFAQLSEISNHERVSAGERGMEAFAANLDDVARQGDLARSVQLSPSGGLIWFRDSALHVVVGTGPPVTYDVNSLEHRFSNESGFVSVNYESGSVMRSDGGLAIVNPRMRCDTAQNTAVVTLVTLLEGDGMAIGNGFGSGTGVPRPPSFDGAPGDGAVASTERAVRFDMAHHETRVENRTIDGSQRDVEIQVQDTANPAQWGFAFERAAGWEEDSSDTYVCEDAETIIVREVQVRLSAAS